MKEKITSDMTSVELTSIGMSKEGIDVAYARCPEGHDTDANGWAFFEKHYVKLVKLALWWTEKFGKSAVSEEFDLDVHAEEYSSAILQFSMPLSEN